ncbi:22872_t:CDS:1, partial [Cetraspora pellucida]
AMNTQYCFAHKSIPYKLVFGQLPHYDTNLVDIFESEESLNNQTLISEGSQSTIVSEISSDTVSESEFSSTIEQVQENCSNIDSADKICSDNDGAQDIDDDSAQELYNDLLSLYCSEIEEDSKNTPVHEIAEIINSDDDFEVGE